MPAPNINTQTVINIMADGWWAGGSSVTLTYSTTGGSWGAASEPGRAGYGLFDTNQAAMFAQAMELWDSYVAAEFTETSGVGNIRVAFTTMTQSGVWGYAYLPVKNNSPATFNNAGDIWVGDEYVGSDFAVGGYDFSALLHEIGHALGLDHTFDGPLSDRIPTALDNTRYSLMSYTDIPDYWHSYFTGVGSPTPQAAGVNPVTPMMFDILVIQDLYGKSATTRAGATTYQFDADVACLQTIFDSSGIDTWNLAGHERRSIIDLRPASFSSIDLFPLADQVEYWVDVYGEEDRAYIANWINDPVYLSFGWKDNVAIAYGTIIENVICGNGNDNVIGNTAANTLTGNRGADNLNGQGGADTLIGGMGVDVLTGGAGGDKFVLNATAAAINRDTIKDFASGVDKIHLENSVMAVGLAGKLGVAKFWTGANAHDANDRIIYNSNTGALYYDPDGTGAAAKIQIATLSGAPTLVAADFLVI